MSRSVFSIAAVALVGSLFGGCANSTHAPDPANDFVLREEDELAQLERVRIGMTADEVDAVLGKPRLATDDTRYYGHTPRIRPIDSPYSPYSIIVRMDDGLVAGKQFVQDHPDAPDSNRSWSKEADGVLERLDREWRARWTAVDDPKSLYSRKAFAAHQATVGFGEIEARAVLEAIQDDELSAKYAGVLPWMIEPLLLYLVRSIDTSRLTRLLSVQCPQFVAYDTPLEVWLACEAPRLGCPEAFGSLLAAWGESADSSNRAAAAESLRAAWTSMGWADVESDEAMVAKFSAWYESNKDAYQGNQELLKAEMRWTVEPRGPLFVPK